MACFADRNSFAFASNIFNFTVDLWTLWQSAAPGFGRRKARNRYHQLSGTFFLFCIRAGLL
jgi:hypothetical protein